MPFLNNPISSVKAKLPVSRRPEESLVLKQLAPSVDERDIGYTSIKNPVTINRMLNQMHYSQSKIDLYYEVDGHTHIFHSSIARVSRKHRQIVIQQPKPTNWTRIIPPNAVIEASCYMANGQISFFSKLTELDENRENYYCLLTLPTEISKFQLRSAYRVFMPPGSCRVELTLPNAQGQDVLFEGAGLDLSTEGCCLRFIGDPYSLLSDDNMLHNLEFNILSGRIRFNADAEIRRLAPGKGGQICAGVKFLPLPHLVVRELQTALLDIQRQQLREQVQIY